MFIFEDSKIYDPEKDGIDHINIFSQGRTELGRLLSNFAHTKFTYPPFGSFNSAEGFYFWYLTGQKHDSFKYLHGSSAKTEGKKYKSDRIDKTGMTDEILEVLCTMLLNKVQCNPELQQMLIESTLPFVHYYEYNGNISYPKGYDWICPTYDEIRNILKGI